MTLDEIREKWNGRKFNYRRMAAAKSKMLTPVQIDKESLVGYFQGRRGRYKTTLESCQCGDFMHGGGKCKHILRLAMELGVLDVKFESDVAYIPTPKSDACSLTSAVDYVEKLSDEAQILLKEIFFKISEKVPVCEVMMSEALEEIVSQKILKITPSEEGERRCKVSCAGWCPKGKVQKYLSRKFGMREILSEDGNGYEFVPALETRLPDDEVTRELIERGYYALTDKSDVREEIKPEDWIKDL